MRHSRSVLKNDQRRGSESFTIGGMPGRGSSGLGVGFGT